jgi:hypothetical protein
LDGLRRCANIDEGLTRNLIERSWAMDTVTCNSPWNEVVRGKSPQLAGAHNDVDVTLELADLSAGQLSAVAALMLAVEAAEERARSAERQLAEHHRHCICRAAQISAEDAAAQNPADEACVSLSLRAAA